MSKLGNLEYKLGIGKFRPLTAKTRVRTPLGPPRMPAPPIGGVFICGGYYDSMRGSKRVRHRAISEEERPWMAAEGERAGPEGRDRMSSPVGEPRWDRHECPRLRKEAYSIWRGWQPRPQWIQPSTCKSDSACRPHQYVLFKNDMKGLFRITSEDLPRNF